MCLAIPGKITSIDGIQAAVDFDGIKKNVNVSLVGDIKEGDFVIVHAGFAIEKVDQNAKSEIDEILNN
ncbi:HypC/HybG/HupF family hydrogenase formation chaperone [Patescibacteria group bacterium]